MKISELPKLGSIIESLDGASFPDITDTHVIVSTTPHYMAGKQSEISPGIDSGKIRDSSSSSEEENGSNTLKASPSSDPAFVSGEFGTYSVPFLALFTNIVLAMAQYRDNPDLPNNAAIGIDSNNQTFEFLTSVFGRLVSDIARDDIASVLSLDNSGFVNIVQTIVNNMNSAEG